MVTRFLLSTGRSALKFSSSDISPNWRKAATTIEFNSAWKKIGIFLRIVPI